MGIFRLQIYDFFHIYALLYTILNKTANRLVIKQLAIIVLPTRIELVSQL